MEWVKTLEVAALRQARLAVGVIIIAALVAVSALVIVRQHGSAGPSGQTTQAPASDIGNSDSTIRRLGHPY